MRIDGYRLVLALLAAGALVLSGCGGHDEISVAEAKEKLAVDCEQVGLSDRVRCRCLADELQARGRSGPQIDALHASIESGTTRSEVTQASKACNARR